MHSNENVDESCNYFLLLIVACGIPNLVCDFVLREGSLVNKNPRIASSPNIVVMFFVLLIAACGPTFDERQAIRDAQYEQNKVASEDEKRQVIEQLEVKFDAVYFPKDLNSGTLTIEFQEFFSDSNDDGILFKATLIDLIRKQDDSFVALFDVSLGLFSD